MRGASCTTEARNKPTDRQRVPELDCAIARARVDSSHACRWTNGCSEFQSCRTRSNCDQLSWVVFCRSASWARMVQVGHSVRACVWPSLSEHLPRPVSERHPITLRTSRSQNQRLRREPFIACIFGQMTPHRRSLGCSQFNEHTLKGILLNMQTPRMRPMLPMLAPLESYLQAGRY